MHADVIASRIERHRAGAESLMTDSCDIHRLTSEWNEEQHKTVTTWTLVNGDVPCVLDDPPAPVRALVTDEVSTPAQPVVKVPVSCEGVEPDDRVTLASGPVVWVTDAPVRTYQVQRRLQCRWVK